MMKLTKPVLAVALAAILFLQTSVRPITPTAFAAAQIQDEASVAQSEAKAAEVFTSPPPLSEVGTMPSLEVAALAVRFKYSPRKIQAEIDSLKKKSKSREQSYSQEAKAAQKQVKNKEKQLSKVRSTLSDPEVVAERQKVQCKILKIKQGITDDALAFLQEQIGRDVQISHLMLLNQWKGASRKLDQRIASGTVDQREFGNVLDIGNRGTLKPFSDQEKDVAFGQREVENARRSGQFPKAVEDPAVQDYVTKLAEKIGRNSDLQVPLHVYVVQQEVRKDGWPVIGEDGQPEQVTNAMALPGGFLVVYAGLVEAARNESELAGVLAHEISHVTARHAARMMSRGTKYGIIQTATFLALSLFAPGLFQAGSYLAYQLKGLLLQSLLNGLGLVFTINALGVSRESEMEADKLGMQYAWKTGYDPQGIITFFDWMATKKGYASQTSFFATHPAFGERTVAALEEYTVLKAIDPKRNYLSDTSEFGVIKEKLKKELYKTKPQILEDEKNKPSLLRGEVTPEACEEILSQEGSTSSVPKGTNAANRQ